jgi:predicted RNase H-like HicB family nuclease
MMIAGASAYKQKIRFPWFARFGSVILEYREVGMKYTVLIEESDEGFAVSVPGLPGCHSQGDTEAEALENIADAIREYLEVAEELAAAAGGKRVAVEV